MSDSWDLDGDGELSSESETAVYADHRESERELREFASARGMSEEDIESLFPTFWAEGKLVKRAHNTCKQDYVPGSCPCPEGWCVPKMITGPFEEETAHTMDAMDMRLDIICEELDPLCWGTHGPYIEAFLNQNTPSMDDSFLIPALLILTLTLGVEDATARNRLYSEVERVLLEAGEDPIAHLMGLEPT